LNPRPLALVLALAGLALGPALPAVGLDRQAFARSLEAEGDWYRAIGVWKELRFEALTGSDRAGATGATQAIVADLWAAGQDRAGLQELARWADPAAPATLDWTGLFQYRLQQYPGAEYAWRTSGHRRYLGLLLARTGRTDEARTLWGPGDPDPGLKPTDARSPWVAAGASVLVPGLGQLYAGHGFDGAQALALVSFFGASTWGTFLYERQEGRGYGLTAASAAVTLVFEAANVYGAWKTAEYFNQNQEAARNRLWDEAVLSDPLPQLTSLRAPGP